MGGLKIAISTDSNSIFIRPNEPDLSPEHLNVFITIATDKNPPPKLQTLSLSLTGNESLQFPIGYFEQNVTLGMDTLIPEAADLILKPNSVYTFSTFFPIDHRIAGYQRCKYGRLYHRLNVKATCPGFLSSNIFKASKCLWLVPYPNDDSAFIYSYTAQGFSEGLGPVLLSMNSAHLTVGGYMRVLAELPESASNVEVIRLQANLLQRITIRSRRRPNMQDTPPEQRFTFLEVKGDEIKKGNWITRLPNDHAARPTSLLQDQLGITVAHEIEVRIQFRVKHAEDDQPLHTYRLTWPVDLPACCFQFASMALPPYSKIDPNPVPEIPREQNQGHESFSHCVCGESMDYLLKVEATLAAGHNAGLSYIDRRQLHREVRMKVAASANPGTPGSPRKPDDFQWERRESEEDLCRLNSSTGSQEEAQ
ncbi:hypothetical protein OC846_005814 [Tilletia horrida]|uniref:Arrestin-like N-terminal domain-containing protein n=1 Tax=Tilletia horrida TaxID=155126 RepID=A0AAN6JP61_9BASI|nr:hypothetical protein OC845_005908 [Tilletia horrida]KAK0545076.1 hypothetical protein OC846_005814 [Tilletia horrida]KAK0561164.1 hypothetical protein OC861_005948 [Tilletia horrida]